MIARRFYTTILLLLLSMVGCTNLPFQLGSQLLDGTTPPEAALSPTSSAPLTAEETVIPSTPGETASTTQLPGGGGLRIWLPPEFDPAGNSPASMLLRTRLEEFATESPEIKLEVRAKALDGAGGFLDALAAANPAAPLALTAQISI